MMKAIRNSQKDSQYCETKVSEFPTSFLIVKNFGLIYVAYVFCISDKLGSLTLAQFVAKYLSRFHDKTAICYLLVWSGPAPQLPTELKGTRHIALL